MDKSKEYRQNAEACEVLSESASNAPAKKRFKRLAEGWNDIADKQDWLDGEGSAPSEPVKSGEEQQPGP
jgi:hypothetical protein